ncbi:MAG: YncE family protein [Prevotella sp.]|nr:YncE family protein [Prevotella sp.]
MLALALLALLMVSSCREDDIVVPITTDDTGEQIITDYLGMYVLCEGNMGSNKATLDYLDLHTGTYLKNIFPTRNPQQVKELGDVGNDVKIYGSRLWLVVNCSNKVEVCDAETATSLGHVDIPNCRYLAFNDGYAYVSSYVGPVGGSSVQGSVYKVDTLSLKVVGQISVGYQPEELAVVGEKLYVANSGGYEAIQGRPYDRTVSVIDLNTFKEERRIDVAPNLFRLRADSHGQLWVSSRGNYADYPSRLYRLKADAKGQMVKVDSVDVPVSDIALRGDSLCFVGTSYDENWNTLTNFGIINTESGKLIADQLVKDTTPLETPYGLMIHPLTGDIYVMDATNYVSSGWLFCFDSNGNFKWKTSTGDIPGHACWFVKQTIKK